MSASPPASAGINPLEEARNPQTTPKRLWELSQVRGEVANAVAANPNTPTNTLLWLAGSCWEAFLTNPVLPLLLLEDPGLPLRLPTQALLALLRQDEPPAEFLRTLQRHDDPEVRDAARLHRRAGLKVTDNPLIARLESAKGSGLALRELLSVGLVPPWLLRWAMESASKALREQAWTQALASGDESLQAHARLLRWLEWLGTRKPRKEDAHHVTPEKMATLAEGGVFARRLAAKNRATPPEVLQRLAGDPSQPPVVRRFAAKNRATPPTALLSLAMTGDKAMRAAVLRNASTPSAALEQLATAPEVDFRRRVAANRNTPPAALARLAQDADEEVRTKVAFNPSTDLATLTSLAQDKEQDVRQSLAQRAGCPLEILRLLSKDASAYVRIRAVDNANFPDRERNERKLRWLLGKHEGSWSDAAKVPSVLDVPDSEVPPEIFVSREQRQANPSQLAADAAHDDVTLRERAARDKNTPPETLALLASDTAKQVRQTIAHNPTTPPGVHAQLSGDVEMWVRAGVSQYQAISRDIFDRLSQDPEIEVRWRLLLNPHLPPEWIDPFVRAQLSDEFAKHILHCSNSLPEQTVLWLIDQRPDLAKAYGIRHHQSAAVRSRIISLLDNHGRTNFIHTLRYSGRHENLPPLTDEQMLQLTETTDDQYGFWRERVYRALLEYQHITPHVLDTLARRQMLPESPRGYRRSRAHRGGSLAMIAAHPRTPPALLAELAQYWNKRVRLAALNNPNTPPEARAIRAQHAVGETARSSSLLGRVCALTHPDAPLASLRRAAFDGTWTERYSVAQNPKCPRDLLALLREDANIAVRDAARSQWQARFSAEES